MSTLPYLVKKYTLSTTGTKLALFPAKDTVVGDTAVTYNDGDENLTVNQQFSSITVTNQSSTIPIYFSIVLDLLDSNTFTSVTAPGADGVFYVGPSATIELNQASISRLRLVAGSGTPAVQIVLTL